MSRLARIPVTVPSAVKVNITGKVCEVIGPKGTLKLDIHPTVTITVAGNEVSFSSPSSSNAKSIQERMSLGTMRALVNNMVLGVTQGFQRKLDLVGVGYRVKIAASVVNLSVGFSHPVDYRLPQGVTAEAPSQTELLLKSHDKHLLGQVASEIRAFRPPEPYKGKGIKYSDEKIQRKEAKKK